MCRSKQTLGHDEAANWPRHASDTAERRTALFEGADGAEAMAVSNVLDRMDIDTMWCPGPGGDRGPRCSLVESGHCDLLEKADFVINNLGTSTPCRAEVADAVDAAASADTPVAVVAGWQQAEAVRGRLSRSTVVEGPLTRQIVQEAAQAH